MNAEHERSLRAWLDARDPGVAPSRLRAAVDQVPYTTGRAAFPAIEPTLLRFRRMAMPVRAALILLVLAALAAAVVGATLLRPWQPFPPRGLIAFTTPVGTTGGTAIRLVAADGTGARAVTPATSFAIDHSPRWSVDGATLLFARNDRLDGTNYCSGSGSVVLYDLATATETVVATGLPLINVAEWSPAGSRIALTHPAPGCGMPAYLSVIDVAIGRVTTSSLDDGIWRVSWSGEDASAVAVSAEAAVREVITDDGELVARCDPSGPLGTGPIEVVDRATGATVDLGVGAAPAWSPDGRALAFAHVPDLIAAIGVEQRVQLAVAGVDGWHVQLLGKVIAIDGLFGRSFRQLELRWTPDGSAIYWIDGRGAHIVEVATGRFADLPSRIADSSDLRWQPLAD